MIRLTKQQLENYTPFPNMVLVKPNRGENELVLSGGAKIFIDTTFAKNQHAPVTGTVIATPHSLNHKDLMWEVDMELRAGDSVVYDYVAAEAAMDHEEGQQLECEGEIYFFIRYDEIFLAKRNGIVIPINGYVLVEPVHEKAVERIGRIVISTNRERFHSERFGKVAYVSQSLIRKYADGDGKADSQGIKPGQYIVFDRACDQLCEYDIHTSIDGNKKFFRMQRRYIQAIISPELVKDTQ